MKKPVLTALLCAATASPAFCAGFQPGAHGELSANTKTPNGAALFDAAGNLTGVMAPTGFEGSSVLSVSVTAPGAYAPADLPVTFTFGGQTGGEQATATANRYYPVSATVAVAGSRCAVNSVFSIPGTGTTIQVSDGNGAYGAKLTITPGYIGASAVPANPAAGATTSSCTAPQFNLTWGVSAAKVTFGGWGYGDAAPSGTGSATSVSGGTRATVSSRLSEKSYSLSDYLIPRSAIGTLVPGLSPDGSIQANIATNALTVENGSLFGSFPAVKNYAGGAMAQAKATLFRYPLNSEPGNDVSNIAPWPDLLQLGGHPSDNHAFLAVYGLPYGNGDYGVVDQVTMNNISLGQGTGVSAGPWSTQIVNVNYDAAARGTIAGSTAPRFIASSQVKDPDGVAHSVTFTAHGALFSPALPAYWGSQLRKNMTIGTNVIGLSKDHAPVNNWNNPGDQNMAQPIRSFFATMTDWDTNSDGTIPSITVDNWIVMYSQIYGQMFGFDGTRQGMIPGTDTVDGSAPGYDTVRSQFTAPALFFGVYTKAFDRYTLCQLNPTMGHGDKNAPNGNYGDQVRECQGEEMDLFNSDPINYDATMEGLTITVGSFGGLLSDSSYLMALNGAGVMPHGIQIMNVEDNHPSFEAWAHNGTAHHQIITPSNLPVSQGSVVPLITLDTPLAGTSSVVGTLAVKAYRDQTVDGTDDSWASSSVHLQFKDTTGFNTVEHPENEAGNIGGQVVFNPEGYQYGVGIGGGGSFRQPRYGAIVDVNGLLHLPNGLVAGANANLQANAFVTTTPGTTDVGATYGTDSAGNPHIGSGKGGAILTSDINYSDIHVEPGHNLVFNNTSGQNGAYLSTDGSGNVRVHAISSGQGALLTDGDVRPTGNVHLESPGGQIVFTPKSGSNISPYMFAVDDHTISFSNSVGVQSTLSLYAVTASGYFSAPLTTPSSSSAACSPGQFEDDADYHYVCTATNHWRRVALSDF